MSILLDIKNLHVNVNGKEILKGLTLSVKAGEVHAIMGPNGAGKSTLSYILAGREGYDITQGSVKFAGQEILNLLPEERARLGLFLAFQYPVEIPGVNNMNFLKTSVNALAKSRGQAEMKAGEFLRFIREKAEILGMSDEMLKRPVNTGFSGGEKKRNEILQMVALEPLCAVLDETDSGLDIDALKVVANGVNTLRNTERSMVVITHYQRLLDYIQPDIVHIIADGKIVETGDANLAKQLEKSGYGDYV